MHSLNERRNFYGDSTFKTNMSKHSLNIGIIGGGPGGLFTAYRLEELCSTPPTISILSLIHI